jgi:hypothetical protein
MPAIDLVTDLPMNATNNALHIAPQGARDFYQRRSQRISAETESVS